MRPHIPVLLNEMLEYLSPKAGERYLDTTFGAGGYSKAILDLCDCNVVALDRDPKTKIYANELEKIYGPRFSFIQTNFAENFLKLQDLQFNGIVMDLGVSSMQLDQKERGFSFMKKGDLDMRMSLTGMTAMEFINNASEEEIADVIYKYGDEPASRKIAKRIVLRRMENSITDTLELADIVRNACRSRGKIDAATKTFQAIRIYINDELGELERFLAKAHNLLAPTGRLVVVSFHSLEDRIIKLFIKEYSAKKVARSKYSKNVEIQETGKWIKVLTKKPISPTREEIRSNPRARSAKLRAIVKGDGYVC